MTICVHCRFCQQATKPDGEVQLVCAARMREYTDPIYGDVRRNGLPLCEKKNRKGNCQDYEHIVDGQTKDVPRYNPIKRLILWLRFGPKVIVQQ